MKGFGSGPGAPGQTRDITAGGYPGSGAGSQSKGNVSTQPMPTAQGSSTGGGSPTAQGSPAAAWGGAQSPLNYSSDLSQASEANPTSLTASKQGPWLNPENIQNWGSGLGQPPPSPTGGTAQHEEEPGGTDLPPVTTPLPPVTTPEAPEAPEAPEEEEPVSGPVDNWEPYNYQMMVQDGRISGNYWDHVQPGSISGIASAQGLGDGTDSSTYAQLLNSPRSYLSFAGRGATVLSQYAGVPLADFTWRSNQRSETWGEWRESWTDDMRSRDQPSTQLSLPWYLQNPWSAWVPDVYLEASAGLPTHMDTVIAAQKAAALAQLGPGATEQDLMDGSYPSAWFTDIPAPPRYMTYAVGDVHNPSSFRRVESDGTIRQIHTDEYYASLGQPGFASPNHAYGPGIGDYGQRGSTSTGGVA